jgi:hypothetical protein
MSPKKQAESNSEDSVLPEGIAIRLRDAFTSANDWKNVSESFIKTNPMTALAGAFFLGFLLSRVARHA